MGLSVAWMVPGWPPLIRRNDGRSRTLGQVFTFLGCFHKQILIWPFKGGVGSSSFGGAGGLGSHVIPSISPLCSGVWDLSSQSGDRTRAPGGGSAEP